jgi:hypothetical protein
MLIACRGPEKTLPGHIGSVTLTLVKALRYLPLTYLVGREGFIYFLPFLLLCVAIHFISLATAAHSR